jgi:hypothetical protein
MTVTCIVRPAQYVLVCPSCGFENVWYHRPIDRVDCGHCKHSFDIKYDMVTVCDKCFQASCWQGVFLCSESDSAGTLEKTVEELMALNLEHPDYWKNHIH